MTGMRRALLILTTLAALLGISQLASARGVTSLCQFDQRFMAVNDNSTSRSFSVGYDAGKNKLRADTIAGNDAGPKACEDPDPWDYFEINLSNGNDGARLDAFKMTNAYKPLPKGIEGYLNGEDGADVLIGHRGYDGLSGGDGRDRIIGDDSFDEIDGGAGRDFVSAGSGPDDLYMEDGTRDEIHCGPGQDGVLADPGDEVANDCENVL